MVDRVVNMPQLHLCFIHSYPRIRKNLVRRCVIWNPKFKEQYDAIYVVFFLVMLL